MSKVHKILIWFLVLSPFLILFSMVQLTAYGFFGPLPSLEELDNPENNLATQVFSENGVRLGEYYFENRKSCQYNELPQHLIDALIATEDVRFENHSGIDARSLLRAVYGVVTSKKESGVIFKTPITFGVDLKFRLLIFFLLLVISFISSLIFFFNFVGSL